MSERVQVQIQVLVIKQSKAKHSTVQLVKLLVALSVAHTYYVSEEII